jgi:hypothetical protein
MRYFRSFSRRPACAGIPDDGSHAESRIIVPLRQDHGELRGDACAVIAKGRGGEHLGAVAASFALHHPEVAIPVAAVQAKVFSACLFFEAWLLSGKFALQGQLNDMRC